MNAQLSPVAPPPQHIYMQIAKSLVFASTEIESESRGLFRLFNLHDIFSPLFVFLDRFLLVFCFSSRFLQPVVSLLLPPY